jgi:epoxyqueuosine reductase QueG
VQTVSHYSDYYPHCASHRAFAEAAGLGWRGLHGLIVTPQAGPALRFASIFVPYHIPGLRQDLPGCGQCRACLEVCPILGQSEDYREGCRRRLAALRQAGTTCGICVRVCWEHVSVRPWPVCASAPGRSSSFSACWLGRV